MVNSKAYYHNFEVYNNEQSKRVSITSLQPKVPTSLSVTVCVSQMTSGFCFLLKGAGNRHDEEEGQSMLLFLRRGIKARLLLSLAKSCGCVRSASVRNSKVRQRPKSLKQRGKNHCFLNDCLFLPILSTGWAEKMITTSVLFIQGHPTRNGFFHLAIRALM